MLENNLQTDGDARAPTRKALRARNLRRLRGAQSSVSLGLLCGLHASDIREMEAKRRTITLKTIDRLAAGLCMEPAQVLAELDRAVLP
jgi:hypothetical protein